MGMDRELPVERFLPLRPVEFDVLLSLAAGERHGYGIIQDAEARGHMIVPDVGTLVVPVRGSAQLDGGACVAYVWAAHRCVTHV